MALGMALNLSAALALPARAADDTALRPEVAKPLLAAQELINSGKAADALKPLAEAEAVSGRTPYEVFATNRLKGVAATSVGDYPTALRALEAVINAGRLTPAEQQPMLQNLTAMAERGGDHAGAIRWAQRYFQAGGTSPGVRMIVL
jgi:hypothetical protein